MTEGEALTQIKLNVATDVPPLVSDGELILLIQRYPVFNEDDELEYDFDSITRASADAWDLKANRCTDHFNTEMNGRGMNGREIYQNCRERAMDYRRQIQCLVA